MNLPFKKRIVQQDTPSDTDSDSVEPPPKSVVPILTTPKPRPVGRPPKSATPKPVTPKATPKRNQTPATAPVGRPRGRPRLSESNSVSKTPKLPKKRNLSDQHQEWGNLSLFASNRD